MARNRIKQALIQALARGDFISGQQFAEQFDVSRAAIAKHIASLTEMGLDIYRVSGKGYRLAEPLTLLSHQEITEYLSTDYQADIEAFSILDSTNDYLLGLLPAQVQPGQVCLTEYQRAGRGRRGRRWISPFGSNLYLSMYWYLEQGMSMAMGLNIVSALALSDAIAKLYQIDVQLKWPNDVYLNDKKLAGILIDLEGQPLEDCHCVIGIGINLSMPVTSAVDIDQAWSDLQSVCGNTIDRNQFAAALIEALAARLEQHKQVGLVAVLDDWHKQDMYLHHPVKILTGNKQTHGICRGINQQGALLLEVDGKVMPIYGGEVSLRGADATFN